MPSTFFGIEIAKRGLITSKLSQDVISHNIINANTPLYSKQRAELSTTIPFPAPAYNREIITGQLGTGVAVEYILGIRDNILEKKILDSNNFLNYFQFIANGLSEIENIINEPNSPNLKDVINEFFNAVNEVANNPENLALRKFLLNTAQYLVNEIKYLKDKFDKLQYNFNEQLKVYINNINNISENIKELNLEIFKAKNLGYNPNDLIDKRNFYFNELSKFLNFQTTDLNNGIIKVEINGHILVGENYTMKLTTIIDPNTNNLLPIFEDNVILNINSGELKAIMDLRDNYLVKYKNYINQIISSLIINVNNIHQNGYALNAGNISGINFFSGTSMNDIDINSSLLNNPSLFAAAKNPFSPGDGTNAIDIVNLKHSYITMGGNATIFQLYETFITELGIDGKIAANTKDLYENLKNNLVNKRESLSGVSLDEEMIELIKFQHAFDANIKVLKVQDEMIEEIINIIR